MNLLLISKGYFQACGILIKTSFVCHSAKTRKYPNIMTNQKTSPPCLQISVVLAQVGGWGVGLFFSLHPTSMAQKKRTMPLVEKMKFPVGIGSRHFSFFLSADKVYFSLVAGSTLTLSADRGCLRPNFFCRTDKGK
jgi:hypothetical protein